MDKISIPQESEGKSFVGLDATAEHLTEKSFFQCQFEDCSFLETSWEKAQFSSCIFKNCTLNQVNMDKCRLQDVSFVECSIVGGAFFKCDSSFIFSITMTMCLVKYCNFSQLPLKKTSFKGSKLIHCTFLENNLTDSDFSCVDLQETSFHMCDLSRACFYEAKNYVIDPRINTIKKARFSFPETINLLKPFDVVIKY